MIYVDSSVLLAYLLAEDRRPPDAFFEQVLISSRLIEYEIWTVLNRSKAAAKLEASTRMLLERLALAELLPAVLERACRPFPLPLRTLDALHLATVHYLRLSDPGLALATYDDRLAEAARSIGFETQQP